MRPLSETVLSILLAFALALHAPALAQERTGSPATGEDGPLPSDLQEQVGVRMILIDVVVVDRDDRTVPDLALEDFEIVVDGFRVAPDTLDVGCAEAMEDARAVRRPDRRLHVPPSGGTRRLVILLDYLHLDQLARAEVLEHARETVRHGVTDGDEVMVAAIAGGLRIEQTFTADRDRLEDVLERMEYDISLWNGNFTHLSEEPFFASLEALFNVLGAVPGHKGIVMYSNSPAPADEDDLAFAALAASASVSRCSVYPVHAAGLVAAAPG
jgi:VWFA-related protein